eukprot:s228_g13.t1
MCMHEQWCDRLIRHVRTFPQLVLRPAERIVGYQLHMFAYCERCHNSGACFVSGDRNVQSMTVEILTRLSRCVKGAHGQHIVVLTRTTTVPLHTLRKGHRATRKARSHDKQRTASASVFTYGPVYFAVWLQVFLSMSGPLAASMNKGSRPPPNPLPATKVAAVAPKAPHQAPVLAPKAPIPKVGQMLGTPQGPSMAKSLGPLPLPRPPIRPAGMPPHLPLPRGFFDCCVDVHHAFGDSVIGVHLRIASLHCCVGLQALAHGGMKWNEME